jgi:hypothetical protein
VFLPKINAYYEKRACQLSTDIQNGFYHVKIGFWILTTLFTKKAFF